jgi:hypothetical protein
MGKVSKRSSSSGGDDEADGKATVVGGFTAVRVRCVESSCGEFKIFPCESSEGEEKRKEGRGKRERGRRRAERGEKTDERSGEKGREGWERERWKDRDGGTWRNERDGGGGKREQEGEGWSVRGSEGNGKESEE